MADKRKSMVIIPVLAGIVFNQNWEVLLARRRKGLSNAGLWEFPGGKLHPGEKPQLCLQRELREELGIEVQVDQIFDVVNYQYPGKAILLLAYLCTYKGGVVQFTDHDRVEWVPISRLDEFQLSPADVPLAQRLKEELSRFHPRTME